MRCQQLRVVCTQKNAAGVGQSDSVQTGVCRLKGNLQLCRQFILVALPRLVLIESLFLLRPTQFLIALLLEGTDSGFESADLSQQRTSLTHPDSEAGHALILGEGSPRRCRERFVKLPVKRRALQIAARGGRDALTPHFSPQIRTLLGPGPPKSSLHTRPLHSLSHARRTNAQLRPSGATARTRASLFGPPLAGIRRGNELWGRGSTWDWARDEDAARTTTLPFGNSQLLAPSRLQMAR